MVAKLEITRYVVTKYEILFDSLSNCSKNQNHSFIQKMFNCHPADLFCSLEVNHYPKSETFHIRLLGRLNSRSKRDYRHTLVNMCVQPKWICFQSELSKSNNLHLTLLITRNKIIIFCGFDLQTANNIKVNLKFKKFESFSCPWFL
jgi:hypothetical protein